MTATRPGAEAISSLSALPTSASTANAVAEDVGRVGDQRLNALVPDLLQALLVGRRPTTGVGSVFQSPECCSTVPAAVRMASAQDSGIEWATV